MPCEEIIQVVGTLIPLESRTLLSNQLAQGEFFKSNSNSNKLLEKSHNQKKRLPLLSGALFVSRNHSISQVIAKICRS
ncbi:hypothetical protein ACTWQL_17895 [Pseudalkalibacillus sp. R45]|uniref:hypothetical protein n=1 Tax=Pseudalkalibacillus sp. R45 TaxID=3457433 RepID=UPI003FCE03A1